MYNKNILLYVSIVLFSFIVLLSDSTNIIKLAYLHFLADYVITTPKMQIHKAEGRIEGIALHSSVHAILIFIYFLYITENWMIALTLSLGEFWWHNFQDHAKSWVNRNIWGNPGTREYWIIFGLDQYLHIYAKYVWLLMVANWS